jgi:hypothetical protein
MKLSVRQLKVIVRSKRPATELAGKYGVTASRIYEIRRGPSEPHFPKSLLKGTK